MNSIEHGLLERFRRGLVIDSKLGINGHVIRRAHDVTCPRSVECSWNSSSSMHRLNL